MQGLPVNLDVRDLDWVVLHLGHGYDHGKGRVLHLASYLSAFAEPSGSRCRHLMLRT